MKKLLVTGLMLMNVHAQAAENVFFPSDLPLPELKAEYECPNDTSPHAGYAVLKVMGHSLAYIERGEHPNYTTKLDLAKGYLESIIDSIGSQPLIQTIQLASPADLNDPELALFREGLKSILSTVKQCKDGLNADGRPYTFELPKHPELEPLAAYLEEIVAQIHH